VSFAYRFRKFGAACLVFLAGSAGSAGSAGLAKGRAAENDPAPSWYTVLGENDTERARAERLAQDYARSTGSALRPVAQPGDEPIAAEVDAEKLAVLSQAEEALREAHELSAQLREAAALRVLGQAEETLLGALEVPGVHAFLAEVYVQLGLCAAQLGEMGLFETAFSRALSLDPRRRLEAAEAPPNLVARARELGQAQDVALPSELSLLAEPAAARGWLDGVALDTAESAVRVRPGIHVLVVRAAGHAPYATLLKLEPGRRAPLRLVLAPRAVDQARSRLQAATALKRALPLAQALARASAAPVLLFEPSRTPAERALVHRCEAEQCTLLLGQPHGTGASEHFAGEPAAYAWLNAKAVNEEPSPAPARPLWKRWPVWTGVALVVIAGVTAAVWATRPAPVQEQRELEIDPVGLPH
jgi:tetratricopeptide (TPR) repeat protein